MPCQGLFDSQDVGYRQEVLGKDTVRVAVEAAVRFGWDKYLGPEGGFVGIDSFCASAPAGQLYEEFGITADAVIAEARRQLG